MTPLEHNDDVNRTPVGQDSVELFTRVCVDARRLNEMNEFGALHLFVADGNCEDEHLEFCLGQDNITPEEREWCEHMLRDFTEEERFAVYAFAQCSDLGGAGA